MNISNYWICLLFQRVLWFIDNCSWMNHSYRIGSVFIGSGDEWMISPLIIEALPHSNHRITLHFHSLFIVKATYSIDKWSSWDINFSLRSPQHLEPPKPQHSKTLFRGDFFCTHHTVTSYSTTSIQQALTQSKNRPIKISWTRQSGYCFACNCVAFVILWILYDCQQNGSEIASKFGW